MKLCGANFDKEEFKNVVSGCPTEHFFASPDYFIDIARGFRENGQNKNVEVFCSIARACTLCLENHNRADPFIPLFVIEGEGKRAFIANDFSEEEINFFRESYPLIEHMWLRARIADLVWVRKKDWHAGDAALAAYVSLPITDTSWAEGGRDCWYRALDLAYMLRRIDVVRKIEEKVFAVFLTSEGNFAACLGRFLLKCNCTGERRVQIIDRLNEVVSVLENGNDFYFARNARAILCEWCRTSKGTSAEIGVKQAQSFEDEGNANLRTEQPDNLKAMMCFEKAVQILRQIPKAERERLGVNEKISNLRILRREAAKEAQKSTKYISGKPIEITECIAAAEKWVRRMNMIEAVRAFANLPISGSLSEIREMATKEFKASLDSMASYTQLDDAGRIVAKIKNGKDFDENHLWQKMIQIFNFKVELSVKGWILPAQRVLQTEYRLTEEDFMFFAKNSPFVPLNREILFARALWAGYSSDYLVAVHLLVPQIENSVRAILKNEGFSTSIEEDGVETEKQLGRLLETSGIEKIFNEDLVFEMRALLCEPFGANLRNELAHGLIGDKSLNSIFSVYAWWLVLRLVFNPFGDTVWGVGDNLDSKYPLGGR